MESENKEISPAADGSGSTNKKPVLDFRELNNHEKCNTGGDVINICDETLTK